MIAVEMKLGKRLVLAAVLTPALWLLLFWAFFVSPQVQAVGVVYGLVYSLLVAFTSAYFVVLFCSQWRART